MSAAGRSAVTPLHDGMCRPGSDEPPSFPNGWMWDAWRNGRCETLGVRPFTAKTMTGHSIHKYKAEGNVFR